MIAPSLAIAVSALLLGVGCNGATTQLPPLDGKLAIGTWGGQNAAVLATDSVTHVHVGCTYGDAPAHITLDADGRFTVSGSYLLRAYPIAVGPTMPAQFSGQVLGTTLTLAVVVNDTVQHTSVSLGPIRVTLGVTPSMGQCPVCGAPKATEGRAQP